MKNKDYEKLVNLIQHMNRHLTSLSNDDYYLTRVEISLLLAYIRELEDLNMDRKILIKDLREILENYEEI